VSYKEINETKSLTTYETNHASRILVSKQHTNIYIVLKLKVFHSDISSTKKLFSNYTRTCMYNLLAYNIISPNQL